MRKQSAWQLFLKLCTQLKTEKQFNDFFELFLTINEREEIATRYHIVKAMIDGKETQRDMAKKYKVSIAKITRGSNQLKMTNKDFIQLLRELMQ